MSSSLCNLCSQVIEIKKKFRRVRSNRFRGPFLFSSPLSPSQVREAPRETLSNVKVVARWKSGLSTLAGLLLCCKDYFTHFILRQE